jgi:RNA polymerase sigma factor (sigma-70 family)
LEKNDPVDRCAPEDGWDPCVSDGSDDATELVTLLRAGDPSAFSELYRRLIASAAESALRIVDSTADAEDVAQDTFHLLWVKRRSLALDGEPALRQWIAGTSRYKALNLRRKAQRRAQAERAFAAPLRTLGPEYWVVRIEQLDIIRECLDSMSALDQAIFMGCVLTGLLYKEVAQQLNLSHASVRNRLHRIRRDIQALLKPEAP